MEWKKLLKPYRLGCPINECTHNPDRNEFQRDFDRIIFSTAFRRLNGKTQVVPFPETDVIHTRLTHSLETASVGKSLGTIVGNELSKKYKNIAGWEIGAIVCSSCLAHDIGNPPLGHSGEKAIAEFFNSERGKNIINVLTTEQKSDFTNFEGNAMGFHILTYSNYKVTKVKGGMGLTYPTLAAFTKYPRPSVIYNQMENSASEKKYGLFKGDINIFSEIAKELKIKKKEEGNRWHRHPLAFLTEAADDICYRIMDIEDGYKHGLISYEKTYELLTSICSEVEGETDISNIEKINDRREKIGYLRAKSINSLIFQVVKVFINNESNILKGMIDKPLCELIKSNKVLKEIDKYAINNIYLHKPVLQVEAAGFQVLPGLLDTFLYALKDNNKESSKKILKLVPKEYIWDYEKQPYESILSITTYVAGMTDTYAVDTYRNFKGIHLPNY